MFFTKKKQDKTQLFNYVREKFSEEISQDRKQSLSEILEKNNYYPSSYANLELTDSETVFCIDKLLESSVRNMDKFWFESFDIKVINLEGGVIDWLKHLVILPPKTAIYLMPFHQRDFECSYFIKGLDVDKNLGDDNLGISSKKQIQMFVDVAQRLGHPVMYDFLTGFSRYCDEILKFPYLARWIDTKHAEKQFETYVDECCKELEKEFDSDDVQIVKGIYFQDSKGCLSEEYEKIFKTFEKAVFEKKKVYSKENYKYSNQAKLQKRVAGKTVQQLIEEGLWTVPRSAEKASLLPVFDYMNKEENYPVFKHFDKSGTDISESVKNDFIAPAYFVDTEKSKVNKDVVKYFLNLAQSYIDDYGFDGLKVNFTEDIFDDEKIEKIPTEFLKLFNEKMTKNGVVSVAQAKGLVRLNEYKDLGFDLVWDESVDLNPEQYLFKYAKLSSDDITVAKIYNDRFGESGYVHNYPSLLGEKGAIFKWFCLKLLPCGKNAKLPVVYLDGDESFTQEGFIKTIFEYVKLERGKNEEFYKKFNAINQLVRESKLVEGGEANIIEQDDDGFVTWMISKDPHKEMLLVVANYKLPDERVILKDDNEKIETVKENDAVVNKLITLPGECRIEKELVFNGEKFEPKDYGAKSGLLEIEVLEPCEFRIFLLRK
ncbi:hypothetical protein IJV79_02620 [bacterium]|nr:hypothetical protein [bacterium]